MLHLRSCATTPVGLWLPLVERLGSRHTYYFRRSIPLAQRQRFGGKREWVRSLGTKDRKEAKRLIPACLIAFDKAMDGDEPGRVCRRRWVVS
ncbi:DUF6538 domain-containing protein [Sphingomonas parapaucimobilis]|uniref:DUF6538 domain-containing protein n=1 Tax=Sphingomonas parapaucimobilis TaxID=28213 RepID=UPI0034E22E5D